MMLKCRYQGRDLEDHRGDPLACSVCDGIEYDPPHVKLVTRDRFSPPRRNMRIYYQGKKVAPFNCPATLPDPRKSDLVEKV